MDRPPTTFIGRGFALRRAGTSDAPAIYERYATDPEVCRYLAWRPHRDIGDTRAFLELCERRWESGLEWTWAITESSEPATPAVGMLACRARGHHVDFGCVLAHRLWNRGITTAAVRTLVTWLEDNDEVRRIWATCDVENTASARVMEKVGMQREGILHRWMIHPNVSPDPRDCYVYARVR